ncbi:hypothetical protein GCM10023194_20460 [Planotetraspora phitsanulokensis]|uniref:Uncharacterized protein n=1 Tax=Planotetraspora phitsanulokensis TaxID=575192 RepID=A0A8J3U660_9ACTN|nr:hypothetical protein [Planotetraspora phitsanulokensis]GII39323.1 hypothetical protein Pph01_43260 [Planotetraspora phitsanulokensis]
MERRIGRGWAGMIFDRNHDLDGAELMEFQRLLYDPVLSPTEEESAAMFYETVNSPDDSHSDLGAYDPFIPDPADSAHWDPGTEFSPDDPAGWHDHHHHLHDGYTGDGDG